MPGLRYGPDFTDDAETMRVARVKLLKQAKSKKGLSNKKKLELKNLNDQIKKNFGNTKGMAAAAKYSRAQMGYARKDQLMGGKATKTVAGITFRARPPISKALMDSRKKTGLPSQRKMGGMTGRDRTRGLKFPNVAKTAQAQSKKAKAANARKAAKAKKAKAAKKAARAKKAVAKKATAKKKQVAKRAVAKKKK